MDDVDKLIESLNDVKYQLALINIKPDETNYKFISKHHLFKFDNNPIPIAVCDGSVWLTRILYVIRDDLDELAFDKNRICEKCYEIIKSNKYDHNYEIKYDEGKKKYILTEKCD
jgi:hypothetical protein